MHIGERTLLHLKYYPTKNNLIILIGFIARSHVIQPKAAVTLLWRMLGLWAMLG